MQFFIIIFLQLHKKIIDRGVPEDAQPGIKNAKVGIFYFFAFINTFYNFCKLNIK